MPAQDRAGVILPWTLPSDRPDRERLSETAGLVEALGCNLAFLRAENVRKPSASHLLSGGLMQRLAEDLEASGCTLCVIDAALSPVQQRNLEKALKTKVIDRSDPGNLWPESENAGRQAAGRTRAIVL